MITTNIRRVKRKHDDQCHSNEMEDVQIGYRCMVCGLFVHKKSSNLKLGGNKNGLE